MDSIKNKKILIAPLNWGLGHASRLIPVIRCLIENKNSVIVAANDQTSELIAKEFPGLRIIKIKASTIRYSKNSALVPKLFIQAPAMIKDLIFERKWIKTYVEEEQPDVIISDNRFGLSHKAVFSIYITHQIDVILPGYMLPFQPLVRYLHRRIIKTYDHCFIPDNDNYNLSGKLSHRKKGYKFNHSYIGVLSGFIGIKDSYSQSIPEVLAVVSGPEPQRSILLKKITESFSDTDKSVWIVAGQPEKSYDQTNGNIRLISHLSRSELKYLMRKTSVLITRAGYTSLMDLYTLERKAILIPTPGQTEQLYLAEYFSNKFGFKIIKQKNISSLSLFKPEFCGEWEPKIKQSKEILCEKLKFITKKSR